MRARGVAFQGFSSKSGLLVRIAPLVVLATAAAFAQSEASMPSPEVRVAPCIPPKGRSHSNSTRDPCSLCTKNGGATAVVMQQPAPPPNPEDKLKSVVPLLQSAIWAILIGAGLVGFRNEIAGFLDRAKSVDIAGVKIATEPEQEAPLSTAAPEEIPVRIRFR